MAVRLLKIDQSVIRQHYFLNPNDNCYYIHEYTANEGYAHSEANNLILNLKIRPTETRRLSHKRSAITSCISDLTALIEPGIQKDGPESYTVTAIPPSRVSGDPDYDDRMQQIAKGIAINTGIHYADIVEQSESYTSSHSAPSGSRKRPEDLIKIYSIVDSPPSRRVFILDDVLVTGSHYSAFRDILLASYPDLKVIGLFIARRSIQNDPEGFCFKD
jgi:predicted amidophosphoribosyltransferase